MWHLSAACVALLAVSALLPLQAVGTAVPQIDFVRTYRQQLYQTAVTGFPGSSTCIGAGAAWRLIPQRVVAWFPPIPAQICAG